ncbi:MAG: transcriptional regulator [Microcystaceae cyanobacterium]
MQSVKIPLSISYEDFITDKLQNPEHAAGFITAILEEENPEPELLRNALRKVITAYRQPQTLSATAEDYYTQLEEILTQTGGQEIYTFIQLLNALGLQLSVEVSEQS